MLGIIVLLALNWLILWFFERKNLSILGFDFPVKRLEQLFVGLLLGGGVCATQQLAELLLTRTSWQFNSEFKPNHLFECLWWHFKSVSFEELIFRGGLLYIALKKLGQRRGVWMSAVGFGIYHWFSYGVFGNFGAMFFVFLMTGIAGWTFAYAFSKTWSLALPFGLHYGWNFIFISLFSKGPLDSQILLPVKSAVSVPLEGLPSLAVFLIGILFLPLLTYFYLKFFEKKASPSNNA